MVLQTASLAIERFEQLGSTSIAARQLLVAGASLPRVIIARTQNAGIGQRGRGWASPRGGVWLTLAWPIQRSDPDALLQPSLALRAGMAVHDAIAPELEGTPHVLALKLPNDVMIGGRKVAGILTEIVRPSSLSGPVVLIGVGINADFSGDHLPAELHASATTLKDVLGREVNTDAISMRLINDLVRALSHPPSLPVLLANARPLLWGVGHQHPLTTPDGKRTTGILLGLTDRGLPHYEINGRVLEIASLPTAPPTPTPSAS